LILGKIFYTKKAGYPPKSLPENRQTFFLPILFCSRHRCASGLESLKIAPPFGRRSPPLREWAGIWIASRCVWLTIQGMVSILGSRGVLSGQKFAYRCARKKQKCKEPIGKLLFQKSVFKKNKHPFLGNLARHFPFSLFSCSTPKFLALIKKVCKDF